MGEVKVDWILSGDREKVTDTSKEEVFLLPFFEISQIFEQVVKRNCQEYGTAYGPP